MKLPKQILLAISMLVLLLGTNSVVWATGGGPEPSCLVDKADKGKHHKIVGVIAAGVFNYDGITADLDVTLSLEHRGREAFFRAHLDVALIDTPEGVLCQVLAANPTNPSGLTIQQAFGLPESAKLLITDRSIRHFNFDAVPNTSNFSAIGEIKLFVQSN